MGINNHWVYYAAMPVSAGFLLWVLSLFQTSPVLRTATRWAIPSFLAGYFPLLFWVEDLGGFSRVTVPLYSTVLLGASLATLVQRSVGAEGRLASHDWFWIGSGLSLYFGATTLLHPAAMILLPTRDDLVRLAYYIKAAINILAMILVARGVLCPLPQPTSGSSFWPAPLPSSSS
jgi:hypothetical protein